MSNKRNKLNNNVNNNNNNNDNNRKKTFRQADNIKDVFISIGKGLIVNGIIVLLCLLLDKVNSYDLGFILFYVYQFIKLSYEILDLLLNGINVFTFLLILCSITPIVYTYEDISLIVILQNVLKINLQLLSYIYDFYINNNNILHVETKNE